MLQHGSLCLMALFRTVMYLAHYWAVRIVWTGPDEGNGRYIAWREQYLPGLYPPCVVDWLHEVMTEIKVFHCVSMIHMDENNSGRRCFTGDVFRGKDFAHAHWLQHLCGRFGGLF